MYLTILQSFNLLDKTTNFSAETAWHCCDLEILSRSLKVVWTGKAQWVVSSRKLWQLSYIYSVWINPNVKVFDKPRYLPDKKKQHANYLLWMHTSHANHIIHNLFLSVSCSNQTTLINYRGQGSKTHNLQLIFQTNLWPWNKV